MAGLEDTTNAEANRDVAAQLEALNAKLLETTQKLAQIEADNHKLREENASLVTAGRVLTEASSRYRGVHVNPMQDLNATPRSEHVTPRTVNGRSQTLRHEHDGTNHDTRETRDDLGREDNLTPPAGRNTTHFVGAESEPIVRSAETAYLEALFSKHLGEVEAMIGRLPGVPAPIRKSTLHSFADTPFSDEIALIEMPRKFTFPAMKMYDGTSDPDNHVAQYKQRMFTTAIQRECREATMCKGFGSSLTGAALQWFINLPNGSIDSFASLTDLFVEQFASSRNLEKTADDLYEIRQKRDEPLRDYVGRFNKEKVSIPCCNMSTAISAFKRGLLPDGDLYKELTKYQCRTMEDVLSRAWAQIKWEEDSAYRYRHSPRSDSRVVRNERSCREDKPYQRPRSESTRNDNRSTHRPLSREDGEKRVSSTWPDISNLSISHADLVGALKEMGGTVRWPKKMKAPDDKRDTSKWCEFHNDHGHRTEDCITLRMEVNELLKKGHLREYLSDRTRNQMDSQNDQQAVTKTAPISPSKHDRVINVISGGSEISGITHSAAKRNTRAVKNLHGKGTNMQADTPTCTISFSTGGCNTSSKHHDALVISLTVANCLMKRILVDNGSSTNILYIQAYKERGDTTGIRGRN
ncbi:Retrotransposon gag domain [Arabidopsis thaliana x Arabidopsis arenosa]|uniref:Retrotransposon gag domain n=1 Tax=Arabidopsis thaliana x Arabidopsis arenosa TaxID=1240361 RepID=A0A8T1Z2T2_9BRAS|nr:Retrotransposon gag domain [Arabidopsis thaliana x Arabidopsis arenosa]